MLKNVFWEYKRKKNIKNKCKKYMNYYKNVIEI